MKKYNSDECDYYVKKVILQSIYNTHGRQRYPIQLMTVNQANSFDSRSKAEDADSEENLEWPPVVVVVEEEL